MAALGVNPTPTERWELEQTALAVLADAVRINAERERGDVPVTSPLAVTNAVSTPPKVETIASVTSAQLPTASPQSVPLKLFSEAWGEYKTYKMAKLSHTEPWTKQTASQNDKSKDLWVEFHGDRPLDQYNEEDAEEFKEALEFIPRFHGKNPALTASMREMVGRARDAIDAGQDVPERLSVKTIKRHMPALSGFYQWLSERKRTYGYRGKNIFRGFTYKKGSSARGMWTEDDLANLFLRRLFGPGATPIIVPGLVKA